MVFVVVLKEVLEVVCVGCVEFSSYVIIFFRVVVFLIFVDSIFLGGIRWEG